MKPHDNAEVLKLASNLRLYAILFRNGADCLQQYDQAVAMATQQQPTQNSFLSIAVGVRTALLFLGAGDESGARLRIPQETEAHPQPVRAVQHAADRDIRQSGKRSQCAGTNLTNEQITEFVDRQANAVPNYPLPRHGQLDY